MLDYGASMDAVVGESAKASRKSAFPMAPSEKLNYTGTRQAELGGGNSRSNIFFEKARPMAKTAVKQLVVCVNNDGYPVSLETRKIYVALRDEDANAQGFLRIVDESGDDYLYPKTFFRAIALPQSVKKAVLDAA